MGHPIGFFIFIIFTFAPFSSFDCWFFFLRFPHPQTFMDWTFRETLEIFSGSLWTFDGFFYLILKHSRNGEINLGNPKKKTKKERRRSGPNNNKKENQKKKKKMKKKKRVPTNSKSPKERKMDGPFRCWSNKVRPTMIVPLIDATLWTRRGPFSAVKKHEKEEKKWAKKNERERERERSWGIREEPNGKNNKTL